MPVISFPVWQEVKKEMVLLAPGGRQGSVVNSPFTHKLGKPCVLKNVLKMTQMVKKTEQQNTLKPIP